MDENIEKEVQLCEECQKHHKSPLTAPLHPWEWPESPWSRIHVDYAGPFLGEMFLLIVDGHSKWMDIYPVKSATSQVTIEKQQQSFSVFGLPKMLSSDNGTFLIYDIYREKLNMGSRISGKEYIKLRVFGDFLQTCSNAMSHIKGLQVLNDCEKNQKMLVKLPEWVKSRWNRIVTEQPDQGPDYPSFHEFASFIAKEARIACKPVSSLHALRHSAETPARRSAQNEYVCHKCESLSFIELHIQTRP